MSYAHTAVVPLRSFGDAKERLREVISDVHRQLLVRRMAEKVITTLGARMPVLVVSSDEEVLSWASDMGVQPVLEHPLIGDESREDWRSFEYRFDERLNAALAVAAAHAAYIGVRTLVVMSADLPLVTLDDIDALLRLPARPGLTLAADKNGYGTNALAIAPPQALGFRFGADSLIQHRLLAYRAGLPVRVLRRRGLEMDLDTPEDLHLLRESALPEFDADLFTAGKPRQVR